MVRQIKVSDTTHEKLQLIKEVNRTGSFDGAIFMMMQGCVDELNIIQREQTALTLTYEGYGNINEEEKTYEVFDTQSIDIHFSDLRKAEIGDIYEPPLGDHIHYQYTVATVVYTEKDFVALKLTTFEELPWYYHDMTTHRLIGVNLL